MLKMLSVSKGSGFPLTCHQSGFSNTAEVLGCVLPHATSPVSLSASGTFDTCVYCLFLQQLFNYIPKIKYLKEKA